MKKAIYTKIIPATDTKPRRVKAFDLDGNSIITSSDGDDNNPYKFAAIAFCQKYGWHGTLTAGSVGWLCFRIQRS